MNFEKIQKERGFQDTSQAGCFQKENAYLLGAIENIRLVEENKENYYRLSQGCFPLSIIEHISNKRPKWISVIAFDQENLAYFKNIMNRMKK